MRPDAGIRPDRAAEDRPDGSGAASALLSTGSATIGSGDGLSWPAALLDRDGVINVDRGYTHRVEDLVLTPTAAEAIGLLNRSRYRVLVVTNQSGVALGLYGEADVARFHGAIQAELALCGAHIDGFYACPYHPDGKVPAYARDHEDRKPAPGMLLRAMREWNVRRAGSFVIGDRRSDAESAAAAGLPSLLVRPNDCDLAAAVRTMLARGE